MKKEGSHLLKHYIIFILLGGSHFSEGGSNLIIIMQLSDLFETESYSNYKCVTK